MKNNKGITLIALVITIIVLLILAGVSIAMLTGENGILTQAERSKVDTEEAELADKINMALNAEFTNLLADGYFSGAVTTGDNKTIGDPARIATANGITGANDETTGDFKIELGTSLTPSVTGGNPVAVLTITARAKKTITGNIAYDGENYKINPAPYPTAE